MAQLDLKKSIKGLTFYTRKLLRFGGKEKNGDQYFFDQRGAVKITDKEVTNKSGELVKIRAISDAGNAPSSDPMVLYRPSSGQYVDSSKAMDAHHSWVYASIKAIADELANTEFRLYQIKKDGENEEIMEHEVLDLMDAVNDHQTGPEFKHLIAAHLELTGNAYVLLVKKNGKPVDSYEEKPASMYLLDPSRVKIHVDKTTFPFKLAYYEFVFESRTWKFQPYQIVQFKYPDPSNQFCGLGTVQGIAEWVDNDNNTTEFLRQFFANGAQIGMIFETDMVSEDQTQELRDSFNEQHAGVKNAYKAMFLPKGVKKPTGSSEVKFSELGFDKIADSNRDKILAGFRVSKTILGTAESDTNRATAETADYVFAKRTIRPKMQLICSYLNEFLVPRFGDDIFITFVDPVPEDKSFRSEEMKNATGGIPVLTPDEAREQFLGLGPIEGGDKLMLPGGYTPAGQPTENTPANEQNGAKATKKGHFKVGYMPARKMKAKTQFSRNAKIRKDTAKSLAEAIAETILSVKKKNVNEMTRDEYESVVMKEKDERAVKYAEKMKVELRKINEKQKKEVLANLERATKKVKAVNVSKLLDLDKWVNLTVSALKPIAMNLLGVEADHALQLIDKPGLDIENTPAAKQAINEAMELMAESYNQNTVDILETKLNEGLSQGASVDELGQLVQDIYAWKDEYAADRVALTESNRIANTAGKIAWKESGVVKEVEWVTSKRDNVCEYCAEQEGKTIPIDENFFDEGDAIVGAEGGEITADYSDIGGPPLHPNCHCGIKPIVSTSIESAAVPEVEKEIDEALAEIDKLDHDHDHN